MVHLYKCMECGVIPKLNRWCVRSMFARLKKIILEKGSFAGYLVLVLMIVIGLRVVAQAR